jgi:hypothetical protein
MFAGWSSAAAQPNSSRVVKKDYVLPSTVGVDAGPLSAGGIHYFKRLARDKSFAVEVVDASGLPVPAIIYQYLRCCDRSGEEEEVDRRIICSLTREPVRLLPKTVRISVAPQAESCHTLPVTPTTGTIFVTFRT